MKPRILIVLDAPSRDAKYFHKVLSRDDEYFLSQLLAPAHLTLSEVEVIAVGLEGEAFTTVKTHAKNLEGCESNGSFWTSREFRERQARILELVSPYEKILTLGQLAFTILTNNPGSISSWRGSQLFTLSAIPLVPSYDFSTVKKMYEWRHIVSYDIKRLLEWRAEEANPLIHHYIACRDYLPLLKALRQKADHEPFDLACDIETTSRIPSCIGIAWSAEEALCVPLMSYGGNYFEDESEEEEILLALFSLLTHPNVRLIGQNFNYDMQMLRRFFNLRLVCSFDTMLAQHVMFPGTPKDLAHLSSLYCKFHSYWKDELEDYAKLPENLPQFWLYNCKDCCITWEIAQVQKAMLVDMGRERQFKFLMLTAMNALDMMERGIRIAHVEKEKLSRDLEKRLSLLQNTLNSILGFELNLRSPAQMKELFYGLLGCKEKRSKKTGLVSCDSKALAQIVEDEPLLSPLVSLIEEARSIGVFRSTFCEMPCDPFDNRMRCSFNISGAETFRFSSSSNVFGTGGNLQNIPKGDE